ncbi:M4 family metallopeptidase [Streptomyces sp. NPDC001107]
MRRPHIPSVAVAVAVTTAATGLAGTAFGTTTGTSHAAATAGTSAASVVSAARAAAFAHSSATGVSQGDELQAEDVMIDPEGARHARFTRAHQGMQVLGGDLAVHLTRQLTYPHDARNATLKAAKDLYGANSAEYNTVDQTWAAVNVTPANTSAARR